MKKKNKNVKIDKKPKAMHIFLTDTHPYYHLLLNLHIQDKVKVAAFKMLFTNHTISLSLSLTLSHSLSSILIN